jgi:hypothetical protein
MRSDDALTLKISSTQVFLHPLPLEVDEEIKSLKLRIRFHGKMMDDQGGIKSSKKDLILEGD